MILGGFVLCTAALCVLLNLVAELDENTEDHLYIENSSRKQIIWYPVIMLVIVFIAFFIGFNTKDGIDVGTISFFKVAGVDMTFFVLCCYLGSISGLIISFLSEYFTS
jgi:Na+/H+-translocating membrane pyrophosphatase